MKKIISYFLLFQILFFNFANANTYWGNIVPYDKHEKMNRKIFNLNLKMNKIVVKNIHIIWATIFPNFVIDSLNRAYTNLEYPKRLISCLLQKDTEALKHETKRFLINTTMGLAGIIDCAYSIFHLEPYDEDMEQALSKCKMKQGSYIVLPFVSSITTRDIFGRILDFILTPTTYISSPIAAAIKLGLLINRTTQIQPVAKLVESNFVDPYDIAKKMYMLNKEIKLKNYDRSSVLSKIKFNDEVELVHSENLEVKGKLKSENLILNEDNIILKPDIILNGYNPKSPVADSLRTTLFDLKDKKNPFWAELSLWNRNFNKKLKTASVEIIKDKEKYNFKYILQKNKCSPLVIIFPSIGEGITSAHSSNIAKIFYDEGYSIIILGSHFHHAFVKSLDNHYPGVIKDDIEYINALVNNTISYLSKKYNRVFLKRTAIATSLGAQAILFLASKQMEDSANNIDKFIAICPPYELTYAIDKVDEIMKRANNLQHPDSIAIIASKLISAYKNPQYIMKNLDNLPFSNYEANLISAYIFHQKLSDLIFNIETQKTPNIDKKELYEAIDNTNYNDYKNKYLKVKYTNEEFKNLTSLSSISNYLINKDNYKIFHSVDDYLISQNQLKELKSYAEDKLTLFSNGSHLGFLYRDEFIEALKKEIKL